MSKSRHSPYVGCSIGLTHKKIPVVGVICQPFLNELVRLDLVMLVGSLGVLIVDTYLLLNQYWAKTGGGAFLNGIRLGARPQHLKDLSECSVCLQCKQTIWLAIRQIS
jgi:fructose-1,6-bisphosphatase/inositol monophosphatase family enzyme